MHSCKKRINVITTSFIVLPFLKKAMFIGWSLHLSQELIQVKVTFARVMRIFVHGFCHKNVTFSITLVNFFCYFENISEGNTIVQLNAHLVLHRIKIENQTTQQ